MLLLLGWGASDKQEASRGTKVNEEKEKRGEEREEERKREGEREGGRGGGREMLAKIETSNGVAGGWEVVGRTE